jgi:hypothetical protein
MARPVGEVGVNFRGEINTFLKTATWKTVRKDNIKIYLKKGFLVGGETSGYNTKDYNPQ